MHGGVWVRGGALESLGNWRSNVHQLAYVLFLPFLPVGYLKSAARPFKRRTARPRSTFQSFCRVKEKSCKKLSWKDHKLIDASFVSWKVDADRLRSMRKRRKLLFH